MHSSYLPSFLPIFLSSFLLGRKPTALLKSQPIAPSDTAVSRAGRPAQPGRAPPLQTVTQRRHHLDDACLRLCFPGLVSRFLLPPCVSVSLEHSFPASPPGEFLPFAQAPDKRHFSQEAFCTALGRNQFWLLPLGPGGTSFMLYENPDSSQASCSYLLSGPAHLQAVL